MQYILNEDEYKEMVIAADRGRKLEGRTTVGLTTKQLQALCTKIADEMPIKLRWRKGEPPTPWGCLITAQNEHKRETGVEDADIHCCDDCPVHAICPYPYKIHSQ